MSDVIIFDDGIPIGWEDVMSGGNLDVDAMCDALDDNRLEDADAIIERAYGRVYAKYGAEILKGL